MSNMPTGVEPKKSSWVKWVLLGCGGLVLLGVVLGGAIFLFVQKATAGPEEVVQKFLAAAAAGNYAAAHDCFSAPLKEVQPYEQFASAAKANSSFFAVTDTSFPNRSIDMSGAELSGTVTLKSGTKVPAIFKLVKENGQWKLISYNIGS